MKKELSSQFSTRQYMRSKDFEIYYYNDRNLSSVKHHTHDYYEFYFFLDGDVTMWIGDKKYELVPGDLVLIPPKTSHHADIDTSEKSYQRFVFWISDAYCNDLLNESPEYIYLMQHVQTSKNYVFHNDVITFNTIQSKLIQLIEELHFDRYGKHIQVSLCVKDLIFYLNRMIYDRNHPSSQTEEQSLYHNLVSYIENHLDESLTLDDLANQFYVSKYHIAHIFKNNVGLSIHQYITKKRLSNCRDAILSHVEITEAFLLYGFKDYSSFYRAFKKEYGLSPKDYKELYIQKYS